MFESTQSVLCSVVTVWRFHCYYPRCLCYWNQKNPNLGRREKVWLGRAEEQTPQFNLSKDYLLCVLYPSNLLEGIKMSVPLKKKNSTCRWSAAAVNWTLRKISYFCSGITDVVLYFQESEPVFLGIHIPFLCLVLCQVLWVQWCSPGWQQSRSTLSCSMFSSWYALPTPPQPSYWQREELSPGRRPQNCDQCRKQSLNCFLSRPKIFTSGYILFCFWVCVWIC